MLRFMLQDVVPVGVEQPNKFRPDGLFGRWWQGILFRTERQVNRHPGDHPPNRSFISIGKGNTCVRYSEYFVIMVVTGHRTP